MGFLDPNTLMLSMLFSSIGAGFFVYGKKQGSAPALICGCALFAITFFIYSPLALTLICTGIIAASIAAMKMGY